MRTARSIAGSARQWQEWTFDWAATDAAGNVQPEIPPWNRWRGPGWCVVPHRLGYGNNAIEVPFVDVIPT